MVHVYIITYPFLSPCACNSLREESVVLAFQLADLLLSPSLHLSLLCRTALLHKTLHKMTNHKMTLHKMVNSTYMYVGYF